LTLSKILGIFNYENNNENHFHLKLHNIIPLKQLTFFQKQFKPKL